MTDQPLLKDLVDIPTDVHKSDFVVSLADGVSHPDRIVDSYVVTDQIAEAFDSALSLVASSLRDGKSKGAYLHGSFGSGKSHFMAVLHLLLQDNAKARSIERLAPVLAKHDDDLAGNNVMLVAYHFVGTTSMEAGVLGGYVKHVQQHHPDAPLPSVFLSDKILDDAKSLRARIGDEAFFDGLGGGDGLEGFGDLVAGWDAVSFEAAVAAAPDSDDGRRLMADLVATYYSSYADQALSSGTGYVPMDEGLAAISAHAKDLGFDGVVLFLDELILWLATRMADPDFVSREASKVAKLIEASEPRAIPLISLIARQRDLRDFVGEGVTGAEQAGFGMGLEWWEGRFATIYLQDNNLPAIIEQRLLAPSSAAAKEQLDQAFEQFATDAGGALNALTTDDADRAAFRASYPFSPALIKVLVGVSAFLQRERTALRLLQQLLVDRRDTLNVGQLVPLGDLWDVVDAGEEPFDQALRRQFAKARQLYRRLEPVILARHDLAADELDGLPDGHAVHTDLRLAKTLLLAALVPEVDAVRGMTAAKLTNLNHQSVRTPIAGAERTYVINRLHEWAAAMGEVRVDGDDQNPSVSLQLVGVDTESIVAAAEENDNLGRRVQLVRELLGEAIGLDDTVALVDEHRFTWRGRHRAVDLAFTNIRDQGELPNSSFRSTPERPKVVIDYPFDHDPAKGPSDDLARVQDLRTEIGPQPTLCWIPRSLTDQAKDDLGRLVVLEHLLTGDRLEGATDHLPKEQRIEAREILSAQRQQLRSRMRNVLQMAYGVRTPEPAVVMANVEPSEQFGVIDDSITIRPPTTSSLADAFEDLVDQLWSAVAPGHPEFPDRVTKADLAGALELVQKAAAAPNQRIDVAPSDRKLLTKVVKPLKLGTVGEAHMVLDDHWHYHFHAKRGQQPGQLTVERLRAWMDEPERMDLDNQVASLVVSAYAIHDDLVMRVQGAPQPPTVDGLAPQTILATIDLPSEEDWQAAQQRVPAIFGTSVSPVLSAANVSATVEAVREVVATHDGVADLPDVVRGLMDRWGVPVDANRYRTAQATAKLATTISQADEDVDVIDGIVAVDVATTVESMGAALRQAEPVVTAIRDANLDLFATAFDVGGELAGRAATVRTNLVDAIRQDQNVTNLVSVLASTNRDATAIMADWARRQKDAPGVSEAPEAGPSDEDDGADATEGTSSLERTGRRQVAGPAARSLLGQLRDDRRGLASLEVSWEFEE